MDQRCGDVGFEDGRMNVLGAAAADALDEVGVVVAGGFAVGAGFDLICDPGFVGVVAVDGEIAVRAVENVADSVGLGVFGTEGGLRGCRLFGGVGVGGEACGGNGAGAVSAGANLGF